MSKRTTGIAIFMAVVAVMILAIWGVPRWLWAAEVKPHLDAFRADMARVEPEFLADVRLLEQQPLFERLAGAGDLSDQLNQTVHWDKGGTLGEEPVSSDAGRVAPLRDPPGVAGDADARWWAAIRTTSRWNIWAEAGPIGRHLRAGGDMSDAPVPRYPEVLARAKARLRSARDAAAAAAAVRDVRRLAALLDGHGSLASGLQALAVLRVELIWRDSVSAEVVRRLPPPADAEHLAAGRRVLLYLHALTNDAADPVQARILDRKPGLTGVCAALTEAAILDTLGLPEPPAFAPAGRATRERFLKSGCPAAPLLARHVARSGGDRTPARQTGGWMAGLMMRVPPVRDVTVGLIAAMAMPRMADLYGKSGGPNVH